MAAEAKLAAQPPGAAGVADDPRDRGGKAQPLLIVEHLNKRFPIHGGLLNREIGAIEAVDDVSFAVLKGETLGIVGESGCGKSTLARVLMGLIPSDSGRIIFDGDLVGGIRGLSLRELRRNMQIVFQDSDSSLNPRLPVQESIAYGPQVQGIRRADARNLARNLLQRVGLEPALFASRYPHELSGGQKQRINIARALALDPRLLILDEAVSALDKSIEAQVLNLLRHLKQTLKLTYIFISHDLNVVRYVSDRMLVMYLGQVVEIGPTDAIYRQPRHPYTKALLASRLSTDPRHRFDAPPLAGDPPNPVNPPSGCRFRTRCPFAEDICATKRPVLDNHSVKPRISPLVIWVTRRPVTVARPRCRSLMSLPPMQPHPEDQAMRDQAMRDQAMRDQAMPDHASATDAPLVEVNDLHVRFAGRDETVWAVNGVSFTLMPGEVLCIIGESGSGKSVTMRALMRLLPKKRAVISGDIRIGQYDIMALNERQLANVRGATAAMVFQEPMTALDPVYTIGRQIAETVMRHDGSSRQAARQRALEILQLVKVPSPERRLDSYPHELSGGLRQRALIALALSCRPRLVLADEPTTALDASVQIQILLLLRKLQQELGMGLIFVTHDLGVAAQIADSVAVMYAGRIVEYGKAVDVLLRPRHPYTMGLLASILPNRLSERDIEAIPGNPPDLRLMPEGCSFAPRCKFARPVCGTAVPESQHAGAGHVASCMLLDELPLRAAAAPEIQMQ